MGRWGFVRNVVVYVVLWMKMMEMVKSQTPKVPAIFVFGDSLVEVGNNNFLSTMAKSNYFPYGIDYGSAGPTGRFSNGKTIIDFVGNIKLLPLSIYIYMYPMYVLFDRGTKFVLK